MKMLILLLFRVRVFVGLERSLIMDWVKVFVWEVEKYILVDILIRWCFFFCLLLLLIGVVDVVVVVLGLGEVGLVDIIEDNKYDWIKKGCLILVV